MKGLTTDQASPLRVFKALLPDLDELVAHMESRGGWLNLQEVFTEGILRASLRWWEFYEDAGQLKALAVLGTLGMAEGRAVLESTMPAERRAVILRRMEEGLSAAEQVAMPDEAVVQDWFAGKTSGREPEDGRSVGFFLLAFIPSLFNTLSTMVHGQSLCALVARANEGDDDALCQAVQVDRTVLFLPSIQARLVRAQFGRDEGFLTNLAYRLRNPLLRSRIRHRKLWLAFALLDEEGLLNLPHETLFDICQDLAVYGREHGVEDVSHLSKRLREYRRAQGTSKNFSRP